MVGNKWWAGAGGCNLVRSFCSLTSLVIKGIRNFQRIGEKLESVLMLDRGEQILGDPGEVFRVGRKKPENFCHTSSPDPTDCPWVSEDEVNKECISI